jgi:hypothetical protein
MGPEESPASVKMLSPSQPPPGYNSWRGSRMTHSPRRLHWLWILLSLSPIVRAEALPPSLQMEVQRDISFEQVTTHSKTRHRWWVRSLSKEQLRARGLSEAKLTEFERKGYFNSRGRLPIKGVKETRTQTERVNLMSAAFADGHQLDDASQQAASYCHLDRVAIFAKIPAGTSLRAKRAQETANYPVLGGSSRHPKLSACAYAKYELSAGDRPVATLHCFAFPQSPRPLAETSEGQSEFMISLASLQQIFGDTARFTAGETIPTSEAKALDWIEPPQAPHVQPSFQSSPKPGTP